MNEYLATVLCVSTQTLHNPDLIMHFPLCLVRSKFLSPVTRLGTFRCVACKRLNVPPVPTLSFTKRVLGTNSLDEEAL
jgi:hypothetical protein